MAPTAQGQGNCVRDCCMEPEPLTADRYSSSANIKTVVILLFLSYKINDSAYQATSGNVFGQYAFPHFAAPLCTPSLSPWSSQLLFSVCRQTLGFARLSL